MPVLTIFAGPNGSGKSSMDSTGKQKRKERLRRFDTIAAQESGPLTCLMKASHSAVDFRLEHPHHFRSVFLGPTHHDGVATTDLIARIGDPVLLHANATRLSRQEVLDETIQMLARSMTANTLVLQ